MHVTVRISRSALGIFHAYACPKSGRKHGYVKARHCGELVGGKTPTEAASKALRSLSTQLSTQR